MLRFRLTRNARPNQTTYGLVTKIKLASLEALLWTIHLIPLRTQSAIGWALGRLLWRFDGSHRKIVRDNLAICFPDWTPEKREVVAKESYCWFTRSVLERANLRFYSRTQLARHVSIEGDFGLAARARRPMMWLVPHCVGLDHVAMAPDVIGQRPLVTVYQPPGDQAIDLCLQRIRKKYIDVELINRFHGARRLFRLIGTGHNFINFPDMDWSGPESEFIPFFGHPAATLLSPSRIARKFEMCVQPVTIELLPGGQGYRIRFCDPLPDFPSDDPVADMNRFNQWLEAWIREHPAQYMWTLERFRTQAQGGAE